jgi:rifampicin phosphotransferase
VWEGAIVEGWHDGMRRLRLLGNERADIESPMASFVNGHLNSARGLAPTEPLDAERTTRRHVVTESTALTEWTGLLNGLTESPELSNELSNDCARATSIRSGRPDLLMLGDAQLIERARSLIPEIRWLFSQLTWVSALATIGPSIVDTTVGAIDRSLALRTMSGLSDIESGSASHALWELSRTVRASSVLLAVFDDGRDGLMDRLTAEPAAAALLAAFDEFLVNFGSWGPKDWEIGGPAWETQPTLALSLLDEMRQCPDSDDPRVRLEAQMADRNAAVAEVHGALANNREALSRFVTAQQSAQMFIAASQRAKTNTVKVVHEVRMSLRELGRRLEADGLIASANDVFFSRADELNAFALDPVPFASLVDERRALMAEQRRRLAD